MKKENTVLSVVCIVLVIVCLVLASALKTAKADIKKRNPMRSKKRLIGTIAAMETDTTKAMKTGRSMAKMKGITMDTT